MRTEHVLHVGDSRESDVADESVDLVVTSPPYPMIEMWDEQFAALSPAVGRALGEGRGDDAFDAMHELLDAVWGEVDRVLRPSGIACVNVGDATRSLDGEFQCFPNHARVTQAFRERGFSPLPTVLWRKPTNRLTKFMGSGMLPTNAYVTLEHEHVLVFRKGPRRQFPPHDESRYESAFFWEERNRWFSDLWELHGASQAREGDGRDRSGSFPLALPLRLVRMYSTYGDRVYDPFAGTGTTTLAAMLAGRDSVGTELEPDLLSAFDDRLDGLPERARQRLDARLDRHRTFVRERDEPLEYDAVHYDFPVVTKQERHVRFYDVTDAEAADGEGPRQYSVSYEPR
ncbi:DNA-methyltransferase [Salinigranum halophilum]|jgi:site-specific DNA-methyltransferase (adenine-specific)|uniref:DNA-methyltransferase n=1 Tax=Salinigranum halophilum TaxID=2565931 RepID=UPI00115EAC07|nr:site-specific DNA-methyltransferase [Salinigranum halophilum]